MRFIIALFAIVFLAVPAYAGDRPGLQACPPYTVDGTQIFEPFQANGKCLGRNARARMTRIVDLKLQALCSVPAFKCVHISEMNEKERAHYDKLAALNLKGAPTPECSLKDAKKSWELEMLTNVFNEDAKCHVVNHGARYYDRVMDIGCVMWDGVTIGCVPYKQ